MRKTSLKLLKNLKVGLQERPHRKIKRTENRILSANSKSVHFEKFTSKKFRELPGKLLEETMQPL